MISKFGFLLIAAAVACCTAQPACTCTREMKPVCGSDGVTYSNECMLNCAKDTSKTDIHLAKLGPCEKENEPTCICTYEYNPVCGTDRKTYSNPCEARCNKVQIETYGECDKIKVVEVPPCTCSKEKKEVCGTDGATYPNACLLNCATAVNSRLGIAHYGPCEELELPKPEAANQEACTCTRNFQLVCGNDGVTYNNDCLLQCASKTKTKDGACEELEIPKPESETREACICARNYRPVCGHDGVTYTNDCELQCAGKRKTKDGACEEVHFVDY